jgi:predicted transcriptional regulator of viral defense system
MNRIPVLKYIKQVNRRIFATHEIHAVSGKSLSATVQGLNYLERQGILVKIRRGLWMEKGAEPQSPYQIIPFLVPHHRAYLSLLSALHLYGIVSQIPQTTMLSSTAHSQTIRTALGTFAIHRIAPEFFFDFDWYKKTGAFLVASPEKALLDCLYLSGTKARRFTDFPELEFPASFSFERAELMATKIKARFLREHVMKRLAELRAESLLKPGQSKRASRH